jgi:hypothetical protein
MRDTLLRDMAKPHAHLCVAPRASRLMMDRLPYALLASSAVRTAGEAHFAAVSALIFRPADHEQA